MVTMAPELLRGSRAVLKKLLVSVLSSRCPDDRKAFKNMSLLPHSPFTVDRGEEPQPAPARQRNYRHG